MNDYPSPYPADGELPGDDTPSPDVMAAFEEAIKPSGLTAIRRLAIEERWAELINMYKAGHDLDLIADTLGYASAEGAKAALVRALRRHTYHAAEEMRTLEEIKLRDIEKSIWPAAEAGDREAIELWLKVHKARVQLFGLGLQRTEITHKGGPQKQTTVILGGDTNSFQDALRQYEGAIIDAETVEPDALPPGKEE